MRVALLTTIVPHLNGGAEALTESLHRELLLRKIDAEIVAPILKTSPAPELVGVVDQALSMQLQHRSGAAFDRVIGLKFPSYFAPHPNKTMWIYHQFREIYDLWDTPVFKPLHDVPDFVSIRERIQKLDSTLIPAAKSVFTISKNVSKRLEQYNKVESTALYPPPPEAEHFRTDAPGDYLYFPSRLSPLKRQSLAIRALAKTHSRPKLVFAGAPDQPEILLELQALARDLGVSDLITWTGFVSTSDKIKGYAECRGVLYTPSDEDLGYITMEAALSSKAVITCLDSGGALEFVQNQVNGLISKPNENTLAQAIDQFWSLPKAAIIQMGRTARALYDAKNISWDHVIEKLIG